MINMRDELVTIVDRDVLKVLSTDTRIDILKLLSDGGRTPSFVAKKLNKSDATIVEHLQTMEKVGLVKKTISPGKKWVFYSLTERGQGILSSKSRRLVIILSSSLIGLAAGVGLFGSYVYQSGAFAPNMLAQPTFEAAERAVGAGAPEAAGAVETTVGVIMQQPTFLLYISIIVLSVSIVGLGLYFYKKSKFEGRLYEKI